MKKVNKLNWRTTIKDFENIHSVNDDIILIEKPVIIPAFEYPFKVETICVVICTKGTSGGKINLQPYTSDSSSMTILLADQILEYEYISEDFEGFVILMSKKFTESLNIEDSFSTFISVRENPCIHLTKEELEAMLNYCSMILKTIGMEDNPNRLEIVRNLTRAFFYGAGYYFHKTAKDKQKDRNELLVDNFMKQVQVHFKAYRGVEFYADKLCLTPKYMSSMIKKSSGKSASEWIDERVVLEAKTLLKSTNMTIQQIADELNFQTQSSFGKYFKRLVGISPKEYRNS